MRRAAQAPLAMRRRAPSEHPPAPRRRQSRVPAARPSLAPQPSPRHPHPTTTNPSLGLDAPLPHARSDPGAEGEGEGYHLWGGASLPDELDSKLSLGGDPNAGGRGSAPPSVIVGSAPSAGAGMAAAAGTQQQLQQQPPASADLASLWGNAQVGAAAAVPSWLYQLLARTRRGLWCSGPGAGCTRACVALMPQG